MAGLFLAGRQSNGNRRVAVGGCLSDLIALARFLSENAVVHTLRFLIGNAIHLHVAVQCGAAPPPLRFDGPFVFHVPQLQVVHLVGTALPEIQLCSFSLHCSLLRFFGFCPSCNAERCMKSKCPSWRSQATSRTRCQGRVGSAFTGAQRTPLTEEAGGLGAVFPREGQRGKRTVQ